MIDLGTFADTRIRRYQRHLLLPEIGPAGQEKLARARVLVVGVGGLGSAACQYLASSGVGTVGLADGDIVEISNLPRQVLYTQADLGRLKTEVAAGHLVVQNPEVDVLQYPEFVTPANVAEIIAGYDVVIDGTDRLDARYVLNDAAVRAGIPLVHGSVMRFTGQVTVFAPGHGCYRCLYPTPPEDDLPTCADLGVISPLPGIIGAMQAIEAMKIITGMGGALFGRMLVVDARTWVTYAVKIDPRPDCPACGGGVEDTGGGVEQDSAQEE